MKTDPTPVVQTVKDLISGEIFQKMLSISEK